MGNRTSAIFATLILISITGTSWAQLSLRGQIVGRNQTPYSAGFVTVVDAEFFYQEEQLDGDGNFTINGMDATTPYKITFTDVSGAEFVLERFRMSNLPEGMLYFQAAGGLLTRVEIVHADEPVGNRYSFGASTILLLGSGFNGDFDARPGLVVSAAFQQHLNRIPLLGAPAAHNFWEYSASVEVNNYENIPQRVDTRQAAGDAQFSRFRISSGPAFASKTGRAEFGLGLSAAFGGIYDGDKVLETEREGEFSVNNFGIYLRGGIGIPLGALDLMLNTRLDLMMSSTGHDADFWSGSVTGLSFGLSFR